MGEESWGCRERWGKKGEMGLGRESWKEDYFSRGGKRQEILHRRRNRENPKGVEIRETSRRRI